MSPPAVEGLRIGEQLGEGATGVVYAASDAQGRPLAIKFLHEALGYDREAKARFAREAKNCGRIQSEFVAQVIGAGSSRGTTWIAYERLEGETLSARLRRERVLAPDVAARVVEHVLRGLEAAHAVGVIHRDVKPANILLARPRAGGEERACLLDFGASKHRDPGGGSASSEGFTSATATLGTVNYMPPEQLGGAARVDARADLYAVGVVAFRALTGQLPFVADSRAAVMHAKMYERARTLEEATGVAWSPEVEALFRRALAPEADARFGSAAQMRETWEQVLRNPRMQGTPGLDANPFGNPDQEDTVLE